LLMSHDACWISCLDAECLCAFFLLVIQPILALFNSNWTFKTYTLSYQKPYQDLGCYLARWNSDIPMFIILILLIYRQQLIDTLLVPNVLKIINKPFTPNAKIKNLLAWTFWYLQYLIPEQHWLSPIFSTWVA
jgi:hypothetical protein